MTKVTYALREDPNSIFLLQDAGRRYGKYCQITMFVRNIVRPEFFRQYLFFAPFTGKNGKYRGSVTNIQMSIEDNGYGPLRNYVAVIDSEVEFKITPSVIRQLSRDHMPAWGMKSYLDYFNDRSSGVLLFLRVYRVAQEIPLSFFEKGSRGSSQILKLYDDYGDEVSLPINVLEPVISDNKFAYLKSEILHILKVENALIALYDDTEKGLNSLQERVIAYRHILGTKERWKNRHLGWLDNDLEDDDDEFDMAQLDYEEIFREVLEICPGMRNTIDYVKTIQPARLGEYDYYLKDIHEHTKNEHTSFNRLFEMSLRAAVKDALYYHKKYDVDLEDAFQEACIGIIRAIQKHNENVSGLFPSYVALWIRQVLSRYLSPYDKNVRIPAHYVTHIEHVIHQLSNALNGSDYREVNYNELFRLLVKYTDCKKDEAFRLAYILTPAESIEEIIDNHQREESITDGRDYFEETTEAIYYANVRKALETLKEREREVIIYRFGFNGYSETSLEGIGSIYGVTRERVRQIEEKAKVKIISFYYRNKLITKDDFKALCEEDKNGRIRLRKK